MINNKAPGSIQILVGTKCDLETERKISIIDAKNLSREVGCIRYIEVSAKNNINIEYCFKTLLESLCSLAQVKYDENHPWMYPHSIKQ